MTNVVFNNKGKKVASNTRIEPNYISKQVYFTLRSFFCSSKNYCLFLSLSSYLFTH
jgi:hypothetical protein